eukprot:Nitzschia sp. Nitz4//scaffold291_size36643//20592//21347//NITZ4_007766-RA/size36643-est2genome-gene-0.8-mRNA-1//-1//CDS//3329546136//3143//frame0
MNKLIDIKPSKQPSIVDYSLSSSRRQRYAKSLRQVSFDDNVEEIPPPPPPSMVPSQIVMSPPRKRRATMVRSKSMLSLVDMENETTQSRKAENHHSSMKKRSKILPSCLGSHPAIEHWSVCESPDILFPPILGLSWGQFVELSNLGEDEQEHSCGPSFQGGLPLSTYCGEDTNVLNNNEVHTISPGETSNKKRRFSGTSVVNKALSTPNKWSTIPRPPSLSPRSLRSEELVTKLRSLQVQSSNRSSMANKP